MKLKTIAVRNVPADLWERFVGYCKRSGKYVPFVFVEMLVKFLKSKGE